MGAHMKGPWACGPGANVEPMGPGAMSQGPVGHGPKTGLKGWTMEPEPRAEQLVQGRAPIFVWATRSTIFGMSVQFAAWGVNREITDNSFGAVRG